MALEYLDADALAQKISQYLGSTEYESTIIHQDIDSIAFFSMTKGDLNNIGVSKMGHVLKLAQIIETPSRLWQTSRSHLSTGSDDAYSELVMKKQIFQPHLSTGGDGDEVHGELVTKQQPVQKSTFRIEDVHRNKTDEDKQKKHDVLHTDDELPRNKEDEDKRKKHVHDKKSSEDVTRTPFWPAYGEIFKQRSIGRKFLRKDHPVAWRDLLDGYRMIRQWYIQCMIDPMLKDIINADFKKNGDVRSKCKQFLQSKIDKLPSLRFQCPKTKECHNLTWLFDDVYDYFVSHRQDNKKRLKRRSTLQSSDTVTFSKLNKEATSAVLSGHDPNSSSKSKDDIQETLRSKFSGENDANDEEPVPKSVKEMIDILVPMTNRRKQLFSSAAENGSSQLSSVDDSLRAFNKDTETEEVLMAYQPASSCCRSLRKKVKCNSTNSRKSPVYIPRSSSRIRASLLQDSSEEAYDDYIQDTTDHPPLRYAAINDLLQTETEGSGSKHYKEEPDFNNISLRSKELICMLLFDVPRKTELYGKLNKFISETNSADSSRKAFRGHRSFNTEEKIDMVATWALENQKVLITGPFMKTDAAGKYELTRGNLYMGDPQN